MFTGLIEEIGVIASVDQDGRRRIRVTAPRIAGELRIGDSIAVNGVCLTAVEATDSWFSADLAAETISRTSLLQLRNGQAVNLELPTRAGTPLGGHIVQGHVDGVGQVIRFEPVTGADDWKLTVGLPRGLERYVVPRGSIALEGISLTVADMKEGEIAVAIIPHTYQNTNLKNLRPGDPVNIEVDILAKYSEKRNNPWAKERATLDELLRQGF
jgi:riboflavin synthase